MSRFRTIPPLLVAALTGVVILGSPSQADAGFKLTLSDGTTSTVIEDNKAGDVAGPAGLITFIGKVGIFDFQVTTGSSNAPGTESLAQLTINNLSIATQGFVGTKNLTITLEDTGFKSPDEGLLTSQLSTTMLPSGSSVTYQSYVDGQAGKLLTLNSVGGVSDSQAISAKTNPYTLKSVTSYTIQGLGENTALALQSTGISAVTAPAPAGLVLVASGVPFLGLATWFRRRGNPLPVA
ncbi:hypothetical protein [Urbifossiella limnaea]|uniref:PEP-CTERM sorting domain-containing protein n=1 Tax=Urbifossiella limnaea TaxID=2528023 RepID=A0A517Y2X0_9BACT|nr:hypothetical protein [Urbifossiella limnaea]QDU24166.1 hypothetical protein ETAA1_61800 [Urbifossiella limnaea]